MTTVEALELIGKGSCVRVVTRSGIEYDVDRDTVLEAAAANDDYVYGHRVKAGGSARGRIRVGSIKWFSLSNAKPVSEGRASAD